MADLIGRLRPWALVLALCWFALAGAFFGGCDGLFRPAKPEGPALGVTPIRLVYSDPDSTLATMALGIEAKGRNNGRDAYLGGLADSTGPETPAFHQFFDPFVLDNCRNSPGCVLPPDDWNLLLESPFYGWFSSLRNEEYDLQWIDDPTHPPTDDDANGIKIRSRKYVVTTLESHTIIAQGFADLTFRLSAQGKWQIARWNDRVDPDVGVTPSGQQFSLGARRIQSRSQQ